MKPVILSSISLFAAAAAFASQPHAVSGKSEATKSCCAKGPVSPAGDAANHEGHAKKMRCSLTGRVVDTCCCVEREGKTHCTLANKDVAECCCTPVEDGASVKDEKSASARVD